MGSTLQRLVWAGAVVAAGAGAASAQDTAQAERQNVIDTFLNCGVHGFSSQTVKSDSCLTQLTTMTREFGQNYAAQVVAANTGNAMFQIAAKCDLGLKSEIRQGNMASRPNQIIENNVGCLNEVFSLMQRSQVPPEQQTTYSLSVSLVECARGNKTYCSDLNAFYRRPPVKELIREL